MVIRKILVPLDFSGHSHELVEKAASLARQLEASLTLLHVFEPPSGMRLAGLIQPRGQSAPLTVQAWLEADVERRVPAFEAIAQGQAVAVDHRLEFGRAAEAIVRVATESGADLIFMGTHGRTGLRRAFAGSVAEEVVRHAEQPVLTVRIAQGVGVGPEEAAESEAELQVLDELEG